MQAGRRELIMDLSCFLCVLISDGPDGKNPLFFTMSVLKYEQHLHLLAEHSPMTQVLCFKTYILQELLGHLPVDRTQGLLAKQTLQSLHGLPVLPGVHIPNIL